MFPNVDKSAVPNIGSTFLGGIAKEVKTNITKDAEEEEWYNRTGWFGSLINAQSYSNAVLMKERNRERLPMIIEYLTGPLADDQHNYNDYQRAGNRKAITMYINPSRLQFNNKKITSKQVTRGGIFYHHWGDDHTIMSISGDLGLSGMSGVKKLDEVYRMSGVLLTYGENTNGPVYYDANTSLMNAIANGDWSGAIGGLVSGKASLSDFTGMIVTHTAGAAQDAITGRKNNGLQSSKIAQKITGEVAGAMQKTTDNIDKKKRNTSIIKGNSPIAGVANNLLGGIVGRLGEKLGGKLYSSKRYGALDYLNNNVCTFNQAFGGFSDIIDELQDPWRPRLIWIYFEDHVYIGHFESFNYTRDAASVNIHYEMSFIIQREIIITSYTPQLHTPGVSPRGFNVEDVSEDDTFKTKAQAGKFLTGMVGL